MKDIAIAAFAVEFKKDMIQFQGFMSFLLLCYWLMNLWSPVIERFRRSRVDAAWFLLSMAFGCFIGVVSAMDWGTEYLLTAISLGLSIGLALCHPAAAVCLLTSLLFLRPWELIDKNDYFAILPKLCFSLCVAHVVLIQAERKKLALHWNQTAILLIAYAIWTFITTFKAYDPGLVQAKYFDTFFKSLLLYLMIMNALTRKEDLRTLQGTILITFLGVGLISIYQTILLSEATNGFESRLKGIGAFSNSNDIAALMVLVFPFCLMPLLRKGEEWPARALSGIVLIVVITSIYLSQSRGAVLALVMALGLYVVIKVRSRALTFAFAGFAALTLVAYFQLSNRNAEDLQESSSSRVTYIKTGLIMGMKNPVLGVGFEGYEENFERYATEILYEWGHRTAHNSWILAFAETGILGLILFAALFISSIWMAWQVFPLAPEFLLSLVGYGITITFLSHTYLLYPYLLYGLIGVAHKVFLAADPVPKLRPAS